jgi:hypothetical protein
MVTIILHCPHCQSEARVARGVCSERANRNIAVMPVGVVAVRIRPPMLITKRAARRSCMQAQERSSLRGLTRTVGVSRATVSSWSKKSSSTSSLTHNPACLGPGGSHFHDAGTGRTDGSFVLKKAHDSWIWIALCRKTRQVVAYAIDDRSRQDVPAVVGEHSISLSPGTLFHRRTRSICSGDPQRAAHSRRQRDRRNRSCRALEEHGSRSVWPALSA